MNDDVFARTLVEVGREPLSVVVAKRIRAAIVSGEIEEGASLPSEKDLGLRLGVGRSTVREALRILQAQGLVTGGNSVSTRGPTVDRSGILPSATTALQTVMLLNQVSVADLVALRLVIESAALEAAAHSGDTKALARAEAALEEMRAATSDIERFHRADVAFHAALIEASNNRAYALVMNVLRDTMAQHLHDALEAEPRPKRILGQLVSEHEAILGAVRAGHGKKAARIVQSHIEDFYDRRTER